jgi:hypothetical protein
MMLSPKILPKIRVLKKTYIRKTTMNSKLFYYKSNIIQIQIKYKSNYAIPFQP